MMAHIRIYLLLLLFAVSLSHVRSKPAVGEYFPASSTENYRPLTGQSDHILCTCIILPIALDKWLVWVVNLEEFL